LSEEIVERGYDKIAENTTQPEIGLRMRSQLLRIGKHAKHKDWICQFV